MVSLVAPVKTRPPRTTQRVVLPRVSWQTYKALLTDLGEGRSARLAYGNGILEITMPSDRHETYKHLLERMVDILTEELDLRVKGFASVTLNREDLEHGAEPDSCYYIQNSDRIQGRQVDLATDPPPDLVIEVDITSSSSHRFNIYQQLGVPEIWRYASETLTIYQLQQGEYVACEKSLTFPIVSTAEIERILHQAENQDDTTLMRSWRRWVRNQIHS